MEIKDSTVYQSVPMEISENMSFLAFATQRQKEIIAMENSISNPSTTKLIFQKLPPQMRRRVMSHNSKRLPIRLREGHMNQLAKSGLPPPSKRPSRCYRRRPKNLVLEYRRRQKTKQWLETHIWHAKRFHMVERWGFKLPETSCDKSFRAAFRATNAHCLLQDISYYTCFELFGQRDYLLSKLKTITNSKFGLTFGAKAFAKGNREGCVEIVHNEHPYKAIGKVQFMWNPISDGCPQKLWIFAHPSFSSELSELILKLFNLTIVQNINENIIDTEYCHNDGTRLTIIRALNRFTLTGPLSNAVLKDTLQEIGNPLEHCIKNNWANEYFNDNETTEICEKQTLIWNSIKEVSTPSELGSHMVLGLIILDPRTLDRTKRTKATPGSNTIDEFEIPTDLCESPLWDSQIRERIKNDMMSNGEICKMKSKLNLVPGENGIVGKHLQTIPIILIQKPSTTCSKLGYGSGWDIIVPPNYAMPLWISLINHGARVGGLRESRSICFESQQHYLFPDTEAGKNEAERISAELRKKYFRLPPSKRVNYVKIGINSPFKCHWDLLINEWAGIEHEYFQVLRDKQLLNDLQMFLEKKFSIKNLDANSNLLIPVHLTMVKKGLCKDFSIICLPKISDLKLYKLKEYGKIPIEKVHLDENRDKRRLERRLHLAMLKKLKRKRLLIRKSIQENYNGDLKDYGKLLQKQTECKTKFSSESLVKTQLEKMKELWLPEKIPTVRNQCSREVMGYVTQGGFSFTQHAGLCLGFVTLRSLIQLRSLFSNNIVLVRNTTSRKYSFASINVIT
ncbi:ribonucleases P/MRP protein subunit POP1-like [Ctenocephalides felis]|uniref:ribonucleases P/MRP protein subunit POP1-like n=1 Tax=Ctenocephalides felis TaxID=7515 RepID=UPI000E6E4741|nr:ribonucleases P/MRP protein subunit POP1-like [Ctenocephalides felis]